MSTDIYVSKGKTSKGTLENGTTMIVLKGGTATEVYCGNGGCLSLSKGGYADYVSTGNNGRIMIDQGALVSSAEIKSGGQMEIYSGGVVSGVKIIKGGSMYIADGAKVRDLEWTPGDGKFSFWGFDVTFANRLTGVHYGSYGSRISSWTDKVTQPVANGGSMFVTFGGTAVNTPVQGGGTMFIFSGGRASDTTIERLGLLNVCGGVASKTTLAHKYASMCVVNGGIASVIHTQGQITVSSGGTATNVTVSNGGYVSVGKGGIIDGITVSAGGTMFIDKGGMVGGLEVQDGAIITNYGNKNWKGTLLPTPSSDCDDGWNNWLYNAKTKERNKYLPWETAGITLSSGLKGTFQVDEKKADSTIYKNFVGYSDAIDFQKIKLKSSAKLSFTVTADDSLKFTVWRLFDSSTYDDLTPKYSLKALQTVTLKWDDTLGKYVANTASLMLEKGDENFTEYFISVECPKAAKGNNAYYDVELNYGTDKKGRDTTYFFSDGDDNFNDWLCTKKDRNADYHFKATNNIVQAGEIQVDETKLTKKIEGTEYHNFVGFGDEKDYGKITLKNNGKLYFTVTATDAAKFSVYKVNEKEGKKGITYSAQSLLSGTLKKKDGVYIYSNAKGLQLLAGVSYYVCVQSTNAKKSEYGAYYNVTIGYEKMDTVKEGKMADALTGNDWGVSTDADDLRLAGGELADDSTGGLDGWTGARGGSTVQDDLNIGQSFAETDLPAIGAASPANILPDDKTGWQNLVSLA